MQPDGAAQYGKGGTALLLLYCRGPNGTQVIAWLLSCCVLFIAFDMQVYQCERTQPH